MHPLLHNKYLKYSSGSRSRPKYRSNYFSKMAKHSPGALTAFKSHQYLCILLISSLKMQPLLHNNHLKFWSEQKYQDGHQASSWDGTTSSRVKSLAFSFSKRERDIFARIWCHYRGIPPKLGIPYNFVLISYRNVRSDTLIWSNDTCFVENFI